LTTNPCSYDIAHFVAKKNQKRLQQWQVEIFLALFILPFSDFPTLDAPGHYFILFSLDALPWFLLLSITMLASKSEFQ
jgi:hypothetical protein